MNSRLVAWSVGLAVAVAASSVLPLAGVVVSLAAPLVALMASWRYGPKAGLLAVAPGAAVLALLGPQGLPVYGAAVLAGLLVARALRAGTSVGTAVTAGAAPFAVWTIGLAASGFDPVAPELVDRWETLFGGAEGSPELRASAEAALGILRNTWVASEVLWFAGLMAVVVALGRRMPLARDLPPAGPWSRLDFPDAVVGVLIVGLALVLLGWDGSWPVVGWNLVFGSGVLYALRGIAIEIFWLDQGRVSRGMRALFFIGNVALFLPVFLVLSAALGLLDTWFDFRRFGKSEGGRHPLSMFHPSSGDDLKE